MHNAAMSTTSQPKPLRSYIIIKRLVFLRFRTMAMRKRKESALGGDFYGGMSRGITFSNSNVVDTHCEE